jgi:hypothetical protein
MAMARAEERMPRHVGDLYNAFLRRGAEQGSNPSGYPIDMTARHCVRFWPG